MFADIPSHDDRFSLTLVPSRPARLWIDLFTYAAIDEGAGAYLFVRNSENGRRTLFSSTNLADMADRITSYMAREIVRRERLEAALVESETGRLRREGRIVRLRHGSRGRGLHHRPADRRGRACSPRSGSPFPEQAPLALPHMLRRRCDRAPDHLDVPAIALPRDAILVVAGRRHEPFDRL